jgi:hemin uptake protein HemP
MNVNNLPSPTEPRSDKASFAREIDVVNAIGSDREIGLLHRGERHRPRMAANGKHILTK